MSKKFKFENQGLTFECIASPDYDCGMPWKENDGHGAPFCAGLPGAVFSIEKVTA